MLLPAEIACPKAVVMSKNPYASSSDVEESGELQSRRPASRIVLWFSSLTVLLSFLIFCGLVTRLCMVMNRFGAPAADIEPAVVAGQISSLVLPLSVTVFVGLGGLVVLVFGLARSR